MMDWFGNLPLFEKIGWSVLGIVLIGFIISVFFFGFRRLVGWQTLKNIKDDKDRISLKIEIIKTVASILGGMFFILTIVVAFLNFRVTQEKHTTDLFTKAIEQLGGNTLEVRLGGIYALERLARDSEKDHGPIMEVLTAFVRANAPWPPEEITAAQKKRPWAKKRPWNKLKEKDARAPGIRGVGEITKSIEAELEEVPPLDADIQAVLTVICRSSRTFQKGESQSLDLTKTDLRKGNFYKAHLEGAKLQFAHLEGAWLSDAHLEQAHLDKAHLEDAKLQFAHLEGARLSDAHLERANLNEAHLDWAHLTKAYLEGAKLEGALLLKADFQRVMGLVKNQVIQAKSWPLAIFDTGLLKELGLPPDHIERLRNRDLSGYNLEGVDLREASLLGFNLKQANLKGARLEGANLYGAYLNGASFQGASLSGADLQRADLRGLKNLEKDQVLKARCGPLAFFDAGLLARIIHEKCLKRHRVSAKML
jgi:uncharacterized protein YjbI with pentapeptide repeats